MLSESPYIKIGNEFLNVHESVVMNILNYRNQYALINKILKQAIETNSYVYWASLAYNIQTSVNMLKGNQIMNIGGVKMEVNNVKDTGSETSKENVKS